jgi:virulence factor Mce-like protein
MRRIALITAALVGLGALIAAAAGADDGRTYEIEMYNAFGIVEGSDVRIAGVNAGTVTEIDVNERKRAVATVELSGPLARLGEDTKCSSEPQSLIAEYFIDCEPAGPELPDGGMIPAGQVAQTVQPDLVQNTMREPFRRRFQILINEFGTALAGNPDDLNEAIRLGAPALRQIQEVTEILASQNAVIRDLNVNSDRIMAELAGRRDDVVRFVEEARDTAEISITRRQELSRNFEILDDFLAELRPTLASLEELAREQRPLLTDLRRAAPELEQLTHDMPPFNRATTRSLRSLGPAARVGRRALRTGRDEIRALARAGRNAPASAEMIADLVRDLDDPRRAVGIDDRVERDTGRSNPRAGRRDTKGYTGFEGLLNYAYYFALGTNTFDQIGHKLAINLYEVFSGPCGFFTTGRDPETGEPGVPAEGGGRTTDMREVARCVSWLGPNQPGITELTDDELPKYHPSVCPEGTYPERARELICDSNGAQASATRRGGGRDGGEPASRGGRRGAGAGDPTLPESPSRGRVPADALEDLLDLPGRIQGGGNGGGGSSGGGSSGGGGSGGNATQDLLDFLLGGGL